MGLLARRVALLWPMGCPVRWPASSPQRRARCSLHVQSQTEVRLRGRSQPVSRCVRVCCESCRRGRHCEVPAPEHHTDSAV
eukprot:5475955-Prymnesium_polylepis.1